MRRASQGVYRAALSCGNLAHGFAACSPSDKAKLAGTKSLNLGIVTSYNDMLSAHQPYQFYPDIIKEAARSIGATAQVAGGVPAMCDGVTQGQPGMDLSLFSRDVIAMATAIALSHNMFDAAVFLGICDKIVPGLLIGALTFGHLPAVFVPAGPMPSGIPNDEKARVRQLYSEGKVGRAELLESRGQVLSLARHLHLLRHRQLQPDADGDHGPPSAGRELRQSRHAAARCADPRGRASARCRSPPRATTTRRSATSSTRRRSSTASSGCTRPAARPTTRCT